MNRVVTCALIAALVGACADGGPVQTVDADTTTSTLAPTTTATIPNPGATWDSAAPEALGFDSARLDQLLSTAKAENSTCVAVARNGVLATSATWNSDAPVEAFSVTKSLTNVLIGVAAARNLLDINDPVATYVSQWRDTASEAVTIRDIMSNSSGREWSLALDYQQLIGKTSDKTAFAIGLAQASPPGTTWAYNNSAIQVLSAVLKTATGMDPAEFARRDVFEPLGMRHTQMTHDLAGNSLMFMGLRTTCEDLTRLGLLMLKRGIWNGNEILKPEYVDSSTQSSTDLNAAYGWLWWTNQHGRIAQPRIAVDATSSQDTPTGQLVAGLPEHLYWALGFNEQYLAVFPESGIIAVRLGAKPVHPEALTVSTFSTQVFESSRA